MARCVSTLTQAQAAVARLCQAWGGAGNPLLPLADGAAPRYIANRLVEGEVDGYLPHEGQDWATPIPGVPYLSSANPWDYPVLVIAAKEDLTNARPIEVVELDPDDPWRTAYLGTLGWMPDELDTDLTDRIGAEPLAVSSVFPLNRVKAEGSIQDLVRRLQNQNAITPRQFSTLFLAAGISPNTGYFADEPVIPDPWRTATAAGPNIVVVMEPESLVDLALLWNLRAAWGDSHVMPIGMPVSAVNGAAIRELRVPGATAYFGFSGGETYLTSSSVSVERLTALSVGIANTHVAEPADLLRFGQAPSRYSESVQNWAEGAARIAGLSADDRDLFRATGKVPSLRLSVRLRDRPIPAVGPLRGRFYADFQSGGAQVQVSSLQRRGTAEVRWPSGWTSLSAAALTLGLDVRESQPGLTAMSLVRAIGSVADCYYLSDPGLLGLLYEMAELSGMSWWKQRWAAAERKLRDAGLSPDETDAIAVSGQRDAPVVAGADDTRQVPFGRFKACFGDLRAAKVWVDWATNHRLLVKGVELHCPSCRATTWVPIAELSPPFVCSGCARTLPQPFGPENLVFKYRLGEVLRRCLENDSLGHVLALRWLVDLFHDRGLVGAHPGVEFILEGRVAAEADVVLLFADGSLVPVEAKRRGSAFNRSAADQLDATSEHLGSPFDVMCVLDSVASNDLPSSLERRLPDRPRFLLTADHLSSRHVMWAMGADPFKAPDAASSTDRRKQWVRSVGEMNDAPADPVLRTVAHWREEASD